MSKRMDETGIFNTNAQNMSMADTPKDIILRVYDALKSKGYDPITQIVGYLISGDPTYITSFNNARSLIRRLERDDILEELVRYYVKNSGQ